MSDYDPYNPRLDADTPEPGRTSSRHAGHETPSTGSSHSDGEGIDGGVHGRIRIPTTPSAAMRETVSEDEGESADSASEVEERPFDFAPVTAGRRGSTDDRVAPAARRGSFPGHPGDRVSQPTPPPPVASRRSSVPRVPPVPEGSPDALLPRRGESPLEDMSGIHEVLTDFSDSEAGMAKPDSKRRGSSSYRGGGGGKVRRGSASDRHKTTVTEVTESEYTVEEGGSTTTSGKSGKSGRSGRHRRHRSRSPSERSGRSHRRRRDRDRGGGKSETERSETERSETHVEETSVASASDYYDATDAGKEEDVSEPPVQLGNGPPLPGQVGLSRGAGAARMSFHTPDGNGPVRQRVKETEPIKDEEAARRQWAPEVLTLDYTPVTAALPSAMRVPLRQRRAGRVVRLVVGVTCYNEDGAELQHTLRGIAENLEPLRRKQGIPPEEVLVMVIVDGMDKVSPSMLTYCRRLGLYDDELVVDEVPVEDMVDAPEGAVGGAAEADVVPTGRAVTMHLFERSVPLPKNETIMRYYEPMPMVLAIKAKNGGKLSSHLWLFEGICRQLHPQYVGLIDVGTEPQPKALSRLIGLMERTPNVGGCCGQIIPRKPRWYNGLEGAQTFEYKTAHQLLKCAEAMTGFITVLPGAFSAYRWEAIRGTPLEKYFLLEATPPAEIDPITANMFLAEDRILCFEIVAQRNHDWILGYDPGAFAETDVPQTLNEFVRQRRRWANGAFGAAIWALSSTPRILRARHSIVRKFLFLIQALYNAAVMVVNWFQPAFFFLAFLLILDNAVHRDVVADGVKEGLEFGATAIYMVLFIVQLVLALAGDITHLKRSYEAVAFIWGLVMMLTLGLAATVLAEFDLSTDSNEMRVFIALSLAAAFGVYFLGACFHMEVPSTFMWVFWYLCYLPSMANMVSTYSIANLNSTSWGTKGAHSNTLLITNRRQEAAIAREDARRLGHAIRDLALTTRNHLRKGRVAGARFDVDGTAESTATFSVTNLDEVSASEGTSVATRSYRGGARRARPDLRPVPESADEDESSYRDEDESDFVGTAVDEVDISGGMDMDLSLSPHGGRRKGGPTTQVPRPGRALSRSRLKERAPDLRVRVQRSSVDGESKASPDGYMGHLDAILERESRLEESERSSRVHDSAAGSRRSYVRRGQAHGTRKYVGYDASEVGSVASDSEGEPTPRHSSSWRKLRRGRHTIDESTDASGEPRAAGGRARHSRSYVSGGEEVSLAHEGSEMSGRVMKDVRRVRSGRRLKVGRRSETSAEDDALADMREELEDYLAAIRRAEEVRAARLRAAEEADRQAKNREFDPAMLEVRFNNFRIRIVLLWFLSNIFLIATVFFLQAVQIFAFVLTGAILLVGLPQAFGSFVFQSGRLSRWIFRRLFFPQCYSTDTRFDPVKTRCCCRRQSYYNPDVEWAEDVRYVRPITAGTGLLHDEGEEADELPPDMPDLPHAYGGVTPTIAEEVSDYFDEDGEGTAYTSESDVEADSTAPSDAVPRRSFRRAPPSDASSDVRPHRPKARPLEKKATLLVDQLRATEQNASGHTTFDGVPPGRFRRKD